MSYCSIATIIDILNGEIVITPLNARDLRLTIVNPYIDEIYVDDELVKVITNSFTIEKNSILNVWLTDSIQSKYVVKYIHKQSVLSNQNRTYLINTVDVNESVIFILPNMNLNIKKLKLSSLFYNMYIVNDDYIGLMYRVINNEEYLELENYLKSCDNFYNIYNYNKFFDLFLFKATDELKVCIDFYLNGKYSKLYDIWKNNIVEIYYYIQNIFKFEYDIDYIHRVLEKDIGLKKALENFFNIKLNENIDLHKIPDTNKEVINLNLIKNE
ncbi:MAG: hypothetical protein HPY57_12700 [Ignavibacteria bacterium]|nr:hypothetical protein [Ignavibacteria bacterium]